MGSQDPTPLALVVRNIRKAYPGVVALDDVSLTVEMGQIHAVVGENGAGKSTLMKVVSGATAQDSGTADVCGRRLPAGDPRAPADAGLAMIYQELTIVPQMTALANVFLGQVPCRWGFIRRVAMLRRFMELGEQIGVAVDPHRIAAELPVPKQRLLEVMRALALDRQVVVMDEPTASLGQDDREHLQSVVRRLRAGGRAVVYISHDLDEVLALADRITVMREGRLIETAPVAEWTKSRLVSSMLGRSVATLGRRDVPHARRRDLFEVTDLVAGGGAVTVDRLAVGAGEILGIGGLVGAGRSELLLALAGADPTAKGSVVVDGTSYPCPQTVPAALRIGVALVPEERQRQGLCLSQPARTNVLLADLAAVAPHGWFGQPAAQRAAAGPARAMGFEPRRLGNLAGTLSGGNQQKLLLARWLHRRPKVLMLDEPTRGIDLGAKEEIFGAIRSLAEQGIGIILVSSDLDEVVNHCDRVAVMARGRIVTTLMSPVTVKDILENAFNVGAGPAKASPASLEGQSA